MEDRLLMSGNAFETSLADMRLRLDGQAIGGVTVITHDYSQANQGGDALLPLAQAIQSVQGGWLLDYDALSSTSWGSFDPAQSITTGSPSHVTLLFDWSLGSQQPSAGWGEAAGDALFGMMVGLGLVTPEPAAAQPNLRAPMHFIGCGMGVAVTSEAVERLAYYHVPVEQLTYLDPPTSTSRLSPATATRGCTIWADPRATVRQSGAT